MVRLLHAIPRPSLRQLLGTMNRALVATSSLSALLFLFLFMFTLLLMSVFGGSFEFCMRCKPLPERLSLPLAYGGYAPESVAPWGVGGSGVNERFCRCDAATSVCMQEANLTQCIAYVPRANFDSFGVALVSTFQIFTGEDWQFILYDGMRSNGLGSVVLYVVLFLIGRYVLLNMYLAIILACFATEHEKRKERQRARRSASMRHISRRAASKLLRKSSDLRRGLIAAASVRSMPTATPRKQGGREVLSTDGPPTATPSSLAEGSRGAADSPSAKPRWRKRSSGGRASRLNNVVVDGSQDKPSTALALNGGAGGHRPSAAEAGGAAAVSPYESPPARRSSQPKPAKPPVKSELDLDEAALALQNKWRQHEARRMTASLREYRNTVRRRNAREASFSDPLKLDVSVPASNPSRKWVPPRIARTETAGEVRTAPLLPLGPPTCPPVLPSPPRPPRATATSRRHAVPITPGPLLCGA